MVKLQRISQILDLPENTANILKSKVTDIWGICNPKHAVQILEPMSGLLLWLRHSDLAWEGQH